MPLTLHQAYCYAVLYLMQTKPLDAALSVLDQCRPEAAADVISDMVLEYIGKDVHARFGESYTVIEIYNSLSDRTH